MNYRRIIKIGLPLAIIGAGIPIGINLSLKSCTEKKSIVRLRDESISIKRNRHISDKKIEKGNDVFKDVISNDFYKFIRIKRFSNGLKAEFDEGFEGAIISTVLKKNIKNIENGTVAWGTKINDNNDLFTIVFQWIVDNEIQATKAYSFQILSNFGNPK